MAHVVMRIVPFSLVVCLATAAQAQTAAPAAQDTSAPASAAAQPASTGLAEIIVTAQRSSQSLQKVPIAVTAISGSTLANHQITSTQNIEAAVPNLSMSEQGVSVTPFLRGVGSAQSNPNDEPSVATYIDGVYIPSPTGNIFKFNDVDRIEVLKGPQGTLFGRNATGGVIQIITRDPGQAPNAEGSISYGSYNTVDANAYVEGGLTSNLAANVSGVWDKNFTGYGTDVTTGAKILKRDQIGLRSKWVWTPGTDTKVTISADWSRLHSTGDDYQETPANAAAQGLPYPGLRNTNADWPNVGNNEVYGGAIHVEQGLDFARLVSISAYRHVTGLFQLDQDSTPLPIVDSIIHQYAKSYSQELQLLSKKGSKINWLVGGFYFHANYAYDPLAIRGLAATPFTEEDLFGAQTTNSLSAYGQATVPLFAQTNLTAGLRYTHERQSTDGSVDADGMNLVPNIHQNQGVNKLTWRLALDHNFSATVLGYVSYNRGIKSGGFNMINPGTPGYQPEVLDSYEVGLKSQFLDNRVRFNVAGFYYNYKEIQVFSIAGGGSILTTNAASAHVYGVDADFAAKVTDRLQISAGAGFLDAHYIKFLNAEHYSVSGGNSCPLNGADSAPVTCDASGNQLVFAPRTSGNLNVDYTVPTDSGKFTASISERYRAKVYTSADNRLTIPAYAVMNLTLGWTARDERLNVSIWARNVFNKAYVANATEQAAFGDIQYYAPPRIVGITVGFKTR